MLFPKEDEQRETTLNVERVTETQHGETFGIDKQTEISDQAEESGELKEVVSDERSTVRVQC